MGMRPRTDTQTRVTTTHFASSTTHAKCNNYWDDLSLAHMLQLLFSVLCFVLIFTSLDTAPKSFRDISRKKSKSWHDRRCCCLGHVTVLLWGIIHHQHCWLVLQPRVRSGGVRSRVKSFHPVQTRFLLCFSHAELLQTYVIQLFTFSISERFT